MTPHMLVYKAAMELEKAKEDHWCARYRQRRLVVEQLRYFEERRHRMQLCYVCEEQMKRWLDLGNSVALPASGKKVADFGFVAEPGGVCADERLFPEKVAGEDDRTRTAAFIEAREAVSFPEASSSPTTLPSARARLEAALRAQADRSSGVRSMRVRSMRARRRAGSQAGDPADPWRTDRSLAELSWKGPSGETPFGAGETLLLEADERLGRRSAAGAGASAPQGTTEMSLMMKPYKTVQREMEKPGQPAAAKQLNKYGLHKTISTVNCAGYMLKPDKADAETVEETRRAYAGVTMTRDNCRKIVKALAMQIREKNRVLKRVIGHPMFKKQDDTKIEDFSLEEVYKMATDFHFMRELVYDPNGRLEHRFALGNDLIGYGTPGPTDCTDLHFCSSVEDSARISAFKRARRGLEAGLMALQRREEASGPDSQPNLLGYGHVQPPKGEAAEDPTRLRDWLGADGFTSDGTAYPPGFEHPKLAQARQANWLPERDSGNPIYGEMLRNVVR
jgi:hypothetical protein